MSRRALEVWMIVTGWRPPPSPYLPVVAVATLAIGFILANRKG